jgi:DNA-directed RNA polymerase subunit beta'
LEIIKVFAQIDIIVVETIQIKINYNNNNNNTKDKEPHFSSSSDALGAYRQKRIGLSSPLWLRWKLDQHLIGSREVSIEVQYESFGTHHEIYAHYLIIGNRKKETHSIYI